MKGIVLAGGKGTRLYPMTRAVSKQLLPIYDKPMIYYPLSVLMLAGIQDILVVSTPEFTPMYKCLLGNGESFGVRLSYMEQQYPRGIAEVFILAESFISEDSVCLILGDNVFYGQALSDDLKRAKALKHGAFIFGYPVKDPRSFGVVEFDENHKVLSIEEKPQKPKTNYVVPGLYFYDNQVIKFAKQTKPSNRGELEITDINKAYLKRGELNLILLGRGLAWLDTGTPQGLLRAAEYVEAIQNRQGFYISCLEEIAWRKGYIDNEQFCKIGEELKMTEYGQYILSLAKGI